MTKSKEDLLRDIDGVKDSLGHVFKRLYFLEQFLRSKFGKDFENCLVEDNVLSEPSCQNVSFQLTEERDQYMKDVAVQPPANSKTVKQNQTAKTRGRPKKVNNSNQSMGKTGSIKCEICQKEFLGSAAKARRNMITHQEVHNKDRKYPCPICGKLFAQRRPRRTHIGRVHNTDKVKIHGCSICEKKFCSTQEVKIHERTHTGEKPYICNYSECDFKCTQLYNLTRHQKTKHEEKTHTEKPDLDPLDPTQEIRISCDLCKMEFLNKRGLTTHLRTIHSIVSIKKPKSSTKSDTPIDIFDVEVEQCDLEEVVVEIEDTNFVTVVADSINYS